MTISVWPGRVLCVWDAKGKLIAEVPLTEAMARSIMRDLLAGWDLPPSPQWERFVDHGV